MAKSLVNCAHCKQDFLKENKFINQQVKLGQVNHFCKIQCLRAFALAKSEPNVNCIQCGVRFFKKPTEMKKTGSHFCSRSCSAKHNNKTRSQSFYLKDLDRACPSCNQIIKVKIGTTKNTKCPDCRPATKNAVRYAKIKGIKLKNPWVPKYITLSCKSCCKPFEYFEKTGQHRKILCRDCWFKIQSERARKAGKKQNMNKRSRAEILFAELCKTRFTTVLENPKMFNGWDADVVIEKVKVAISWNGPWHYRKIKSNHHLGMVQNRDKIKNDEILNAGYRHYIIKDDGKFSLRFVNSEFTKFIEWVDELP